MELSNFIDASARGLAGNVCQSKAATIVDATAAATISTGAISYAIDGVFKTPVTLNDGAYSAGHDKVLAGYSCLFAYCLNAAGALVTFQGQVFKPEGSKFRGYKTNKDSNGVVTGYTQELALTDFNCAFVPTIPAGHALFALGKIVATAEFVPGTTAHNTGNTTTFSDVMALPAATNL